jgi:hypothetical protein
MAGLSEEQGRKYLAAIMELRETLDVAFRGLRAARGPGDPLTAYIKSRRDFAGSVASEMQTMLGPEDRGPAEVREFRPRKKGSHRA